MLGFLIYTDGKNSIMDFIKILNERERIEELKSYEILDTLPEKEYNYITDLACHISGSKTSLISLVDKDRQWFKAKKKFKDVQTSRKVSFCSVAIQNSSEHLIIEDARKDKRFSNNPLVNKNNPIIFYAGFPLVSPNNFALGTLCVINDKPQNLTHKQISLLKGLSLQVINLLELRKKNIELRRKNKNYRLENINYKNFVKTVSHDLKMPLANIITSTDIIHLNSKKNNDFFSQRYLKNIKEASFSMSSYIDGLLHYYESETFNKEDRNVFMIQDLLIYVSKFLALDSYNLKFNYSKHPFTICSSEQIFEQIFINLIGNSIKYNDKSEIVIDINFEEDESFYTFKVKDNGMGISKEDLSKIFNLFETINVVDSKGKKGFGIGLATVKNLVTKLNGSIQVDSVFGQWTEFTFRIEKTRGLMESYIKAID